MLTLAVDTSSRTGSLALLRDGAIVGVVSTSSDEAYSSRMFRQLYFLLDEIGIGLSDVDLYAVLAGPGSFTGLRVGLAAVKGWAEVYNRTIAAVSGLEAVAAQVPIQNGMIAAVLDARRGQVYGAIYEKDGERLEVRMPEGVSSAEEFLRQVESTFAANATPNSLKAEPKELFFASPAPEVLRDALANSSFAGEAVLEVSPVLAPTVGRLGIARAARGETVSALELDAVYVRRKDAETKWNDT